MGEVEHPRLEGPSFHGARPVTWLGAYDALGNIMGHVLSEQRFYFSSLILKVQGAVEMSFSV